MISITICVGSSCHLKGSHQYIDFVKYLINENKLTKKVELNGSFCMEKCLEGVNIKIDNKHYSFNELNDFKIFIKKYFNKELGVEI